MSAQEIESDFPRLAVEGCAITSPKTEDYNCAAWAGGDMTEKWDPDKTSGRYWPKEIPRSLDLETFIQLYHYEGGYSPCLDGSLEDGYEKLALFLNPSNEVTHVARQVPFGEWTSKLGGGEDIRHKTLTGLEGAFYGKVAQFLKRRISS